MGHAYSRIRLPHELQVEKFLNESGFQSVHEMVVIQGLLAKRADPNRLKKQDRPSVGLPFTSALTIICSCLEPGRRPSEALGTRRGQQRGGHPPPVRGEQRL